MTEFEEYYMGVLYPFQDGVMTIVKQLNLPFYLTGGTALSRHYYNHRFSDDLDLFVNNNDDFGNYVNQIYKALITSAKEHGFTIDQTKIIRFDNFAQFALQKEENITLKLEFVNDVASHFGEFEQNRTLGKVDSIRNILSNKFSAIFRYQVKDIADIWQICRNYKFEYSEILSEAKSKEAGIDAFIIYEIIKTMPVNKIEEIKWIKKPEISLIKKELDIIADDIFHTRSNSLCT